MRKHLWAATAVFLLLFASCATQKVEIKNKIRIAVMDFAPGVGVEESEVAGLSDMLINSLYNSGKFTIVERAQLNQVLKEQKLQQSDLTNRQIVEIGKILGVQSVVIGGVNFIPTDRTLYQKAVGTVSGEYNIDIRAVDCTSGELITTAGATKTNRATYRDLMEQLGKELSSKIVTPEEEMSKKKYQEQRRRWMMGAGIPSIIALVIWVIADLA